MLYKIIHVCGFLAITWHVTLVHKCDFRAVYGPDMIKEQEEQFRLLQEKERKRQQEAAAAAAAAAARTPLLPSAPTSGADIAGPSERLSGLDIGQEQDYPSASCWSLYFKPMLP